MINTCRSSWQIQTVPQAKGYQKNINSSKLQLHHQSVCESFSPVPFPWTDVLLIAAPLQGRSPTPIFDSCHDFPSQKCPTVKSNTLWFEGTRLQGLGRNQSQEVFSFGSPLLSPPICFVVLTLISNFKLLNANSIMGRWLAYVFHFLNIKTYSILGWPVESTSTVRRNQSS